MYLSIRLSTVLRLAEQLARQRDDLLGAREAAAAVPDGPATENIAEGITDNIKLARRLLEEHAGEPQDWLGATAATAEASQPDAEVSLTTEDPVPPAAVSSGSAWSAAHRGEERHQGTPSPEAVLPLPGKTKRGEEQREEQQIDVGGATRWSRGPAAPAIPAHRNEAPADTVHVEESGAWVLASVNARGSVTDFTVVDIDRGGGGGVGRGRGMGPTLAKAVGEIEGRGASEGWVLAAVDAAGMVTKVGDVYMCVTSAHHDADT